MRKREVSDSELGQIKRLKQTGASWLKIQNETGVPRRAAKRAYEEWQRNQSMEGLKQARVSVAAELFREHVDSLTGLAECLATHLCLPKSPNDVRTADQVLNNIWGTRYQGTNEQGRKLTLHQSKLLLESLRQHIEGELRWESLNEWKRSWNSSIKHLKELQKKSHQMLVNMFNQEKGFEDRIREASGERDPLGRLTEFTIKAVLENCRDVKRPPEWLSSRVAIGIELKNQTKSVFFDDRLVLRLDPEGLAEKVVLVWNKAANNLYKLPGFAPIEALRNDINTMKKEIDELVEMLNPLILRPVILRTRCELCPV